MKTKIFKFYPPKKEKNPILLPDSNLLPSSILVPLSKNAKLRKFKGATNTKAAFGPVNAQGMSSALSVIPGPSTGGYGVSSYGALAYGESVTKKAKTKKEKSNRDKKYFDYDAHKNLFESI